MTRKLAIGEGFSPSGINLDIRGSMDCHGPSLVEIGECLGGTARQSIDTALEQ
jgi:hypothetical protein